MERRTFLSLTGAAAALAGCASAGTDDESDGADGPAADDTADGSDPTATRPEYAVETVADGFDAPWALRFLPDGERLLVTERVGRLNLVDADDGTTTEVTGPPEVYARGQGGLLDVALHPEFPDRNWVYLTYAAANDAGDSATHVGRGRLAPEAAELTEFEQLHVAEPFVDSDGHFGSRLAFDDDGLLYVTVGDRQFKNFGPDHVAQDLTNELGATLRLTPDGSIPETNPFVDDPEAVDSIFSYGHRNAQGMTVHPETGALWQAEFGEQDGDELNIVERGDNYGWPVADEGCTYGGGDPIGVSHAEREDVTAPVYSWDCGSGGFPPSGATFYTGDAFPAWQGDLFVGGLASQYLARFAVDGRDVTERERLVADRGWRVRDVVQSPATGALYLAIDDSDAPVVRLVPA